MSAPDFIQIPMAVLRDPELGPSAKLVWGRLKLYAGEDGKAYPKHASLAKEVCLSARQLKNVLGELRQAGWISWTRTRLSCVYAVHSDRQSTSHLSTDQIGNGLPISAPQIGNLLPIREEENCPSRWAENCLQNRSSRKEVQKDVSKQQQPLTSENHVQLRALLDSKGIAYCQDDMKKLVDLASKEGATEDQLHAFIEQKANAKLQCGKPIETAAFFVRSVPQDLRAFLVRASLPRQPRNAFEQAMARAMLAQANPGGEVNERSRKG